MERKPETTSFLRCWRKTYTAENIFLTYLIFPLYTSVLTTSLLEFNSTHQTDFDVLFSTRTNKINCLKYLLWKEDRDKPKIVFEWEHTLYRAKKSLDTLMWLNKEYKALTRVWGGECHTFLQCCSYFHDQECEVLEPSRSQEPLIHRLIGRTSALCITGTAC